jgi:diaminopropionate ammonia-lyase
MRMIQASHAVPAIDPVDLWADYRPTRLITLPALAWWTKVRSVYVKNEADRPLGNFKALGGMLAGLRALARVAGAATIRELITNRAAGSTLPPLICASDGNHGLAVAAAARRAGAGASIYLPAGVSRVRAERIQSLGGEIVWIAGTYDDAVNAAADAAARGEGLLIPDTTPNPDDPVIKDVMAGYALLARELIDQFNEMNDRPSHVFIQAGVGGLAAAVADGLHSHLREPQCIAIVEPESAACVARALALGRTERIAGDLQTSAEMLSCGLASASALKILQQYDVRTVLVSEGQLHAAPGALLAAGGPATTSSGAAGLAGLCHAAACPELRSECRLEPDSTVLLVATEGLP